MTSTARRRARVLVIEDNPDAAALLTEVLRAAGFDARSWSRAEGVTDVLLTESVAVLVVAFSGRGIGATTELVAELRRRPEAPLAHAGIVALVDDEIDTLFGLAHSADRVLVRPMGAASLVDAVTEVAATHADSLSLRRDDRARLWSVPLVDAAADPSAHDASSTVHRVIA